MSHEPHGDCSGQAGCNEFLKPDPLKVERDRYKKALEEIASRKHSHEICWDIAQRALDGEEVRVNPKNPDLPPDIDLAILDWVLEEQLAGRKPTTEDVAHHFALTIEEAQKIHDDLEKAGEFD